MKLEETVKQSDNEDNSARGKTMEGSDNEVEDEDNPSVGDAEGGEQMGESQQIEGEDETSQGIGEKMVTSDPPVSSSFTPPTTRSQSKSPKTITNESKCDYIIYTIRNPFTEEVVAVLIQTKTTLHRKFKHAVAQVSPSNFSLSFCACQTLRHGSTRH